MSGLDDFKKLLAEFRGLSAWAVGGAVAVPFAAALVDFSPPWPPGIVLVTAVAELIALVFVFQFLKSAKRRSINQVLIVSTAGLSIASVVYLILLSLYTYRVPTTGERFVKGYNCTPEAKALFKDHCPDLGLDELRTAEYEAERLWTRRSLTLMRVALVILWSAAFILLSLTLGAFIVYQMNVRGRGGPKARNKSPATPAGSPTPTRTVP
ncbi:MAG: hypothetical protein ACJ76Y_16615 [Thermoanaerobaculia bacterium]